MSDMTHVRWQRDDREPVWQQIERITTWRGDEARSIAYRVEWEGKLLEAAIRAEVIETLVKNGIEPDAIVEIALHERWGVIFCAGVIMGRLKSFREHQYITDYLAQHVPTPPAPVILSGIGKTITDPVDLPDELNRVVATHTGKSNFMVTAQPAGGGYHDLLINRIGAYHGNTMLQGKTSFVFDIRADGAWTITIEAVRIAPRQLPVLSGTGDMVSDQFFPPVIGTVPYRFTHTGKSNFVAILHSTSKSTLLHNTLGPVRQYTDVTFPATLCWWEIKTEGTWRIDPGGSRD
jgi:hypothetical protein